MTDLPSDRPPRRPRYRGKNPRLFHEKYKEHQPDKYADDIHKIVAAGRTPAGSHRPILVAEILKILSPRPGEVALDCTLGYGGHARELLPALQPGGRLIGLDVDPIELPKTEARLATLGCPAQSVIVRRMNFAGISTVVTKEAPEGVDILLADLGVSSMQIDDPQRGFTFKVDAPLDMRMNPEHGQSAAALLSKVDEKELADILFRNSDEPLANELASAIVAARSEMRLERTGDLVDVVSRVVAAPRSRATPDLITDTIRRVFQSLRIAVNDEFGALDALLRQLPYCLRTGARVAILSFHSGEDRRVKHAFKNGLHDGLFSAISEDVIRPSFEEQRTNPRSSSAKLRYAIRR
jgi:16S rRNA (cytosine1402-N4)-methyltransferase